MGNLLSLPVIVGIAIGGSVLLLATGCLVVVVVLRLHHRAQLRRTRNTLAAFKAGSRETLPNRPGKPAPSSGPTQRDPLGAHAPFFPPKFSSVGSRLSSSGPKSDQVSGKERHHHDLSGKFRIGNETPGKERRSILVLSPKPLPPTKQAPFLADPPGRRAKGVRFNEPALMPSISERSLPEPSMSQRSFPEQSISERRSLIAQNRSLDLPAAHTMPNRIDLEAALPLHSPLSPRSDAEPSPGLRPLPLFARSALSNAILHSKGHRALDEEKYNVRSVGDEGHHVRTSGEGYSVRSRSHSHSEQRPAGNLDVRRSVSLLGMHSGRPPGGPVPDLPPHIAARHPASGPTLKYPHSETVHHQHMTPASSFTRPPPNAAVVPRRKPVGISPSTSSQFSDASANTSLLEDSKATNRQQQVLFEGSDKWGWVSRHNSRDDISPKDKCYDGITRNSFRHDSMSPSHVRSALMAAVSTGNLRSRTASADAPEVAASHGHAIVDASSSSAPQSPRSGPPISIYSASHHNDAISPRTKHMPRSGSLASLSSPTSVQQNRDLVQIPEFASGRASSTGTLNARNEAAHASKSDQPSALAAQMREKPASEEVAVNLKTTETDKPSNPKTPSENSASKETRQRETDASENNLQNGTIRKQNQPAADSTTHQPKNLPAASFLKPTQLLLDSKSSQHAKTPIGLSRLALEMKSPSLTTPNDEHEAFIRSPSHSTIQSSRDSLSLPRTGSLSRLSTALSASPPQHTVPAKSVANTSSRAWPLRSSLFEAYRQLASRRSPRTSSQLSRKWSPAPSALGRDISPLNTSQQGDKNDGQKSNAANSSQNAKETSDFGRQADPTASISTPSNKGTVLTTLDVSTQPQTMTANTLSHSKSPESSKLSKNEARLLSASPTPHLPPPQLPPYHPARRVAKPFIHEPLQAPERPFAHSESSFANTESPTPTKRPQPRRVIGLPSSPSPHRAGLEPPIRFKPPLPRQQEPISLPIAPAELPGAPVTDTITDNIGETAPPNLDSKGNSHSNPEVIDSAHSTEANASSTLDQGHPEVHTPSRESPPKYTTTLTRNRPSARPRVRGPRARPTSGSTSSLRATATVNSALRCQSLSPTRAEAALIDKPSAELAVKSAGEEDSLALAAYVSTPQAYHHRISAIHMSEAANSLRRMNSDLDHHDAANFLLNYDNDSDSDSDIASDVNPGNGIGLEPASASKNRASAEPTALATATAGFGPHAGFEFDFYDDDEVFPRTKLSNGHASTTSLGSHRLSPASEAELSALGQQLMAKARREMSPEGRMNQWHEQTLLARRLRLSPDLSPTRRAALPRSILVDKSLQGKPRGRSIGAATRDKSPGTIWATEVF